MIRFWKSHPPLTSVSPWTRLLRLSAVAGVVVAGGQRMAAQSDDSAEPDGSTLSILSPELQDYGWTPGMAPTAAEAELEDVSTARRGYFAVPGVSEGFDSLFDQLDELYTSTGVRMGAAYTMLFQGLSGGPWDQYGGAGDFDLFTSWTAIGRGTENTGRFVFDLEDRHEIGSRTPNSLGGTDLDAPTHRQSLQRPRLCGTRRVLCAAIG